MEVKVFLRDLRTAPRKSREVADLIRGKNVAQARAVLEFTVKKASDPILKLLNSAISSASHDFHVDDSKLFIKEIRVDEGPKLKRWHPMSRGRAYPIIKRSSHITLILNEINPPKIIEKREVVKTKPKTQVKNKKTRK